MVELEAILDSNVSFPGLKSRRIKCLGRGTEWELQCFGKGFHCDRDQDKAVTWRQMNDYLSHCTHPKIHLSFCRFFWALRTGTLIKTSTIGNLLGIYANMTTSQKQSRKMLNTRKKLLLKQFLSYRYLCSRRDDHLQLNCCPVKKMMELPLQRRKHLTFASRSEHNHTRPDGKVKRE